MELGKRCKTFAIARAADLRRPRYPPDKVPFFNAGRVSLRDALPAWSAWRRSEACRSAGANQKLVVPDLARLRRAAAGTGDRSISTTMAFVRVLNAVARDVNRSARRSDRSAMYRVRSGNGGDVRQLGIYSIGRTALSSAECRATGILVSRDKLGRDSPGRLSKTSRRDLVRGSPRAPRISNHELPMIPFYIFYSDVRLQRVGDLAWAAGGQPHGRFLLRRDVRVERRINGEELQHRGTGSSQVAASFIPKTDRSSIPRHSYEAGRDYPDGLRRHARRAGRRLLLIHHAE